ncbi:HNH endonuclease signature motif containing protein [Actinomadura sp. 7K507]|uniref:HNH endonuclease signature motif containing protein n=1 Tax=Actinomadura sp. 7K507 TaxID=2530365 RepID=UPI0010479FEE|nr:HNH endonuclease signature motif containing protein [Actinomadura sp. 7K507]TDC85021.1 HNH endonuclease [Actinomadura sp. 7K507]
MPLEVVEGPEIVVGAREWENREWFPPGPQLAICLSGGKERLADLTDDELLQVAAAARRQTSWAQARELAAIAELTQRRTSAEADGDPDYRILSAHESVTEEVAAALTVTGNTAATLVHLAEQLTGPLAETGAALEAGRVDMAKARVICDITDSLPDQVAQRVESAVLEKASIQTAGQLRRRIKRVVQRLAPEAVEERKREAVRQRRLELWETAAGTADLALCDLAPEDAHAVFNKITAAAHGIKADGDTRPLNLIRADLATQLLNGAELPTAVQVLLAQAEDAEPSAPTPAQVPDDDNGDTTDTTDTSDTTVTALAALLGQRLAHLRGRTPAAELPAAVDQAVHRLTQRFAQRRDELCQGDDDQHGRPGYRPPASLRREIEARHATCVFPSCNQPSHRCDLDHTIPWRPGVTCRCNLAPLCRRHHRLKQTPGWKLHHLWPGLLVWTTPAGAWYIIRPDRQ